MDKKIILFNAPPACVDGETEYMSPTGWRKISEYDGGMVLGFNPWTDRAEFQNPRNFINEHYTGRMLHYQNKNGNMRLTANHSVLYYTSRNEMRVKPWGEIFNAIKNNSYGFAGRIRKAFLFSGDGISLSDDEIRLVIAITADSSTTPNGSHCFNLKRKRKIERLRGLLTNLGYSFKEYQFPSMPGFTRFEFKSKFEKGFPETFYNLSTSQLKVFADEIFLWDGDTTSKVFRTTKKPEADLVQYLLTSLGNGVSLSIKVRGEDNKPTEYIVHTLKESHFALGSNKNRENLQHTEELLWDAPVYCFEMWTSFWVARRNNQIFITGNSGKDEAAKACVEHFAGSRHMEFKAPLVNAAISLSGMSRMRWDAIYNNRQDPSQPSKETPLEALGGLSQRSFLIMISESWVKPSLGVTHFGKVAAEQIRESKHRLFFFSDSGFLEEVEPLFDLVGKENVGLVRIWRPGKNFKGDSRNYLPLDEFSWSCDLMNVGDLDKFKKDVIMTASAFIGDAE